MSELAAEQDAAEAVGRRILALAPRLGSFDHDDYLAFNPDLAGVDLPAHFADHGVWEGRRSVAPERLRARLARALLRADLGPLADAAMERGYRGAMRIEPVLHQPVGASDLDKRAARRIAAALDQVGVEVEVTRELPGNNPFDAIVVGPAKLFEGRSRAEIGCRPPAVMVATQAPDHPDFAADLPYLAAGSGVIALEAETSALFKAAGLPSLWLGGVHGSAPGDDEAAQGHPLLRGLSRAVRDAPPGLPWNERPIDIAALEPRSPARIQAWARMAERMAGFRTVVYQPEAGVFGEAAERSLRQYVYARSKIVLHLHGETPRLLSSMVAEEAAAAGALVLSEPCSPHPMLKPGRHYVEASARRMPDAVAALLQSPGGEADALAAIAASHRALSAASDLEATGLALVNLLLDAREAAA